jgi:integrase
VNTLTYRHASVLAPHIVAYIAHRNALGKRNRSYRYALKLLDQYLVVHRVGGLSNVTPSIVDGFFASRPRRTARSFNTMLSDVTCFFRWLVVNDVVTASPVTARRRRSVALRPFLFDRKDARRLLDAAGDLVDVGGHRGLAMIYPTAFALLYGLGLRAGEVSRLLLRDVDLTRQLLEIRNSKFAKDRLVPFGPKLGARIRRFIRWRAAQLPGSAPDAPLFTFDRAGHRAVHPTCFTRMFKKLVKRLDFPVPPGTRPPHLHCLRHSFAVGTLVRWYKTAVDPNANLFRLSTFLGHVDPSSTAIYLTITDELLEAASQRYARYAGSMLQELQP